MTKQQLAFHKSRRENLLNQFDKHTLILILGNPLKNKSFDGDYTFKQNKNFYYLTGFTEPNSALLLAPGGMKVSKGKNKFATVKEILFVQEKNKLKETWTGKRLGSENVPKELGIQHGILNADIYSILLANLTPEINKLYINIHDFYALTGEMKKYLADLYEKIITMTSNVQVCDINYTIGKMRNVKTPFEINQMKISADICVNAFDDAIRQVGPGLFEYQVQSILQYNYKIYGAKDDAFDAIVASGNNACTLHYEENTDKLKSGDLLLIDSGAEYEYYNSDITRTIPISGKFSKEQKEIYELVLKIQKEIIKKTKPGVKLSYLKKYTVDALAGGLLKLKIIKNKKEITKYYMHGVGHHLGLDTHDACKNTFDDKYNFDILRAGNVITDEPGIYIPKDDKDAPAKYRGIGVRIEDDLLVTKNGCEVITGDLAKEVRDIEEIMCD
jgi:Xaa-Pro aminopeptidase